MPLPTVVVAGTIDQPDTVALTGATIEFSTLAEMVDAAGNVLVPRITVVATVVGGQIKAADGTSVLTLYASDTGATTVPYMIRENFGRKRRWAQNLTTSMVVGGHIPYAALGPVSPAPTPTSPFALLADLQAEESTRASVDATLTTDVAGKAPMVHTHAESDVTALTTDLAGKVPTSRTVNGHALSSDVTVTATDVGAAATVHSHAETDVTSLTADLAAKADLVAGVIPTSQLPALAINDTFPVASQAAMLALTAQRGDVAIRSDLGKSFILSADDPTILANWLELPAAGKVTSVNGQQGVIVLAAADVGADASGAASTAQTAAQTYADTVGAARIKPRGAWATATAYAVNDEVVANGTAWRCITAHTSGATFSADPTKWERFGVAQVVATAPSSPATGDLWYDTSTDLLKRYNGAAWVASGTGTYLSLLGPNTPLPAGQWIHATQSVDHGGVAVDLIDLDFQSSGDGVYVINRGGKPVGYVGSIGGCSSFNTLIPHYDDYDPNVGGNGWTGTVVQTATNLTGITVQQEANTDLSRAAYLENWGNGYAVVVNAQTDGAALAGRAQGTGGALRITDASVGSSVAIVKQTAPQTSGSLPFGGAADAIIALQETVGSVVRAVQVMDSTATIKASMDTDGQTALGSLLLNGSGTARVSANVYLQVNPSNLGDLASGSWNVLSVQPSWKPTNDLTKSPTAANVQLTVNDANATGNLTGTIAALTATAVSSAATRSISQLVGAKVVSSHTGAAAIGSTQALLAQIQTSGTGGSVTTAETFKALSPSMGGTKAITTQYGVHIANQGNALIATSYGLIIDAQSGSTSKSVGIGLGEGVNIEAGTTTGTKVGTGTSQKLGFFNATPVIQPTGTPAAATDLTTVLALANSLRTNLLALGLVA